MRNAWMGRVSIGAASPRHPRRSSYAYSCGSIAAFPWFPGILGDPIHFALVLEPPEFLHIMREACSSVERWDAYLGETPGGNGALAGVIRCTQALMAVQASSESRWPSG